MLESIKAAFWNLVDPVVDLIKYIVFFFFDTFCTLVEYAIGLISLPANLTTNLFDWAGLPPQLLYILNAIGIPTCLGIVSSAYLVRFLLNLIPSWATRA